jgi:hypothetical protein
VRSGSRKRLTLSRSDSLVSAAYQLNTLHSATAVPSTRFIGNWSKLLNCRANLLGRRATLRALGQASVVSLIYPVASLRQDQIIRMIRAA